MTEPSDSSLSSDEEDKTQAEQNARKIHNDLAIMLDRELDPKESKRLRQATLTYLPRGDLSKCDDNMDIFNKLCDESIFHVGDYGPLKEILKAIGREDLAETVKCREDQIRNVLQSPEERATTLQPEGPVQTSMYSKLKDLRDKSHQWQEECNIDLQVFVKTEAYNKTREQIYKTNNVVVLADSGDGKSFILKQISVDMAADGYLTLHLNDPDEIEDNFENWQKILYVFDDLLGHIDPQARADHWIHKSDGFFQQFMDSYNVKFIFASRKLVWSDCRCAMETMRLFNNIVDVSSDKLSPYEKEQMMRNHFADELPSSVINRISQERIPAFPTICRLISTSRRELADVYSVIEQFRNPFKFVRTQVHSLQIGPDMFKYAVLVLVMLNKGELPVHQLEFDTVENTFKCLLEKVLNVCRIHGARPFGELKKTADKLCGTFLAKDHGCLKFCHDSVHEAVVSVYGENNSSHILDFCDAGMVVSVCRPRYLAHETDKCIVKLDEPCYPKFVEILSNKVRDGGWFAFQNPVVQDETFQAHWIEHLQSSEEILYNFINNRWDILYHAARSGAFQLLDYLCENAHLQTLSDAACHPFAGMAAGGHIRQVEMCLDQLPTNLCGKVPWLVEDTESMQNQKKDTQTVQTKVAQLLFQQNDLKDIICEGLIQSSSEGHTEVVKLFLRLGLPRDALEKGLEMASFAGHEQIAELLCTCLRFR